MPMIGEPGVAGGIRAQEQRQKLADREAWETSFGLDTKAAGMAQRGVGKDWASLSVVDQVQWRISAVNAAIDSGTLSPSDLVLAKASQLYWGMEAAKQAVPGAPEKPAFITPVPTPKEAEGPPWPFDVFLDAFKEFVKLLGDALKAIWQGFVAVLDAVGSWLKRNLLDPLWRLVRDLLHGFGSVIASVMGVVLTAVTSMVHPSSPLSPEMALPMFGTVAASMLAIQGTFIGVNATHPIKDLIGPTAFAMVNKFLGFEELSSAFWGSLGGEILDQPMRLWARMTFRARVPDHRLADEMYWHGELNDDEWHRLHTYEGWPDETIAKHGRSQWREPSVREIGMIMDVGGMSIDEISAVLRHRGTDPEMAKVLAAAIVRRPLTNELSQLRSQLITECVAGDMTAAELESALQVLGVTDGEISLIRQIVALRASRAHAVQATKDLQAYRTERVRALTQAYERDLLSDGEYLEELLFAGVEQLRASQTVYLEQVKKIPRPKRVYPSASA